MKSDAMAQRSAACVVALALTLGQTVCAAPASRVQRSPLGAKGGGDAAKKQRADLHLKAGTAAFEKAEYPLAITELEASYAEVPNPTLLYAIGQAHRMNGDCTRAAESYRAYLQTNPSEKQRDAATANLQRCEAKEEPAKASPAPEPAPTPVEETAPVTSALPAATEDAPVTTGHAWYADVPGHILVGTGLAAGIVGGIVFAGGRGKVEDADGAKSQTAFDGNRSDADSGLSQQRIGLVVLGVGGALIIGGVVRYATVGGKRVETGSLHAGPTPSGLLVTGTF